LALPPLVEQEAIAKYLDDKSKKFDAIKFKTKELIDRLKEYRTAIITNAVTGKVDMRNYQSKQE
jgi:type I restriction enzyme S subunit